MKRVSTAYCFGVRWTKHCTTTTTIMRSCVLLWLVLAIIDLKILQAFQMSTITPTVTSSTQSTKDNSSNVSARKELCYHSAMGWSVGCATARTSSINKERSKLYYSSRNIGSSLFFGFGRCDVEDFSGSTTSTALFMTVTSSRQDQTTAQDEDSSMPGSTTSADIPNAHSNSSSNPTSSSLQEEQEQQQQQPLSDIDTQVLRSLLEDQPDLAMEENIQRLLRKNELWEQQQLEKQQQQQQDGDSFTSNTKKSSKFSSKTMQDIEESGGGDIFWNSIKAKAGDLLGQVGLAILNKIERDLTVSLSLGAFFLERAARDTSRALKAATTSSAQKKVVYSLSSNSSYVERQTFQLPSESSSEYDLLHQDPTEQPPTGYTLRADVDLREELNTPADEFKSVTKGIVEILKSGGTTATATKTSTTSKKSGDGSSSSSSSSSSTFNVVRGDDDHNKRLGFVVGRTSGSRTERGQRAYKARKETVLKREKEFVGKKVIRTTTDVMVDGSWQLKEELRKEPAGYKTKVLRQQVSRNVQNVLEGASSVARAALQTSRAQKDRLLSSSLPSEENGNDTPYVAGEEQTYQQREVDGTASSTTGTSSKPSSRATSASSNTMKRYEEHLIKMLKESKRNLLLNLQVCLEDPRDTWLVESVLMDRDTILRTNSDALSNIVQQMVKLRDELLDDTDPTKQSPEDTDSSSTTNNINDKVSYLREEMEVLAYRIQNLHISATKAVGSGAAQLLLKELVWDIPFVDGDTASILLPELPTTTEDDDTTTTTTTTTKEEQEENVPFFARTSSKQVWEEEDCDDDEEEDLFLWPDQENDSEAPIKTVLVRRRDIMSSDELKTDEYESMKPAFTNTGGGDSSSAFSSRKNNVMDADVTDDADDNNMYNDGVTTVEFEFSGGSVGAGSTVGTSIGDNIAGGGSDNAFDIEVISSDDDDFDFNPSRVKQASGESSSNNNSRYDNTKFNDVGEYGTELANESDRPPNFLQELALRSLDVAFYVVEKTFVEVVPTAVEGGQLAYKRYDQAQKQGLGQEGWQPLDNVQDAARRY